LQALTAQAAASTVAQQRETEEAAKNLEHEESMQSFVVSSGLAAVFGALNLKADVCTKCLAHAVQWFEKLGVRRAPDHPYVRALTVCSVLVARASYLLPSLLRVPHLTRCRLQADTVGDLVHANPGSCAEFVNSLGLPEVKAKKLLVALGGALQGEVLRVSVVCEQQRVPMRAPERTEMHRIEVVRCRRSN
jgi:hypothetical protein